MVVFTTAVSGEYRTLASDVAADRDERVVTDPSAVAAEEPVVYVDSPDAVDDRAVRTFQSQTLATGGCIELGIVTGRTPAEARALYDRRAEGDGDHCLLVQGTGKRFDCCDDDATLLQGDDISVERLRELTATPLSSFSATLKGTDIHGFLREGYLCGFPKEPDRFEFDGLQPPCVSDGERDCTLDADLLLADDVHADHVLLNGCISPLLNAATGPPVNLGLGFLANATSVVAPYRVVKVSPLQAALHHALLRAGYTAAERAHLLNRSATTADIEAVPYVAFGRPTASVHDSVETAFSTTHRSDGDSVYVEVDGVEGPVVDVTLPASAFDGGWADYFVRNHDDAAADDPLYYVAFEDGDDVRVVLWSWGALRPDSLTLELAPRRLVAERSLGTTLGGIDALEDVGLVSGKARGQLRNAYNTFLGSAEYLWREPYEANVHRKLAERFDQVESSVENARDSTLDFLHDRGPQLLQSEYRDSVYPTNVAVQDALCPYCGSDVYTETVEDVFGRIRRTMGKCPHCAYIFDVPSSGAVPEFPTLDGDVTVVQPGDRPTVSLSFTNPFDRRVDATYTQRIIDDGYGDDAFDPEHVDVTLAPDESRSVAFELDTSDFDPRYRDGHYHLDGYVLLDTFQVYAANRTIRAVE
jgi:hypothetical protein